MARSGNAPNLAEYRTVGEAASYLGVSTATLRNWDRSGKLKPRRHPHNGYRIYLHEDLEAMLRAIEAPERAAAPLAPLDADSNFGEREHFVQFYESDDYLVESLAGYVGAALASGAGSVVISTPEHRYALEQALAARGVDLAKAKDSGRYVALDAADTLAKLMVGSQPDPRRFAEVIGSLVSNLGKDERPVFAFGEMVALLWAAGNRDGAIRLEQLWNELGKSLRFSLCCAYPIGSFGDGELAERFAGICDCHSRVIPAESYQQQSNEASRLRAVALLQQKAQTLEAETAYRKATEKALIQREREITDFFERTTQGPQARAAEARQLSNGKLRVLVVDDNCDSGDALSALLRIKGHQARAVRDGAAAIAAVADFLPEVILMDVAMPGMDGYEATRRIRQLECGRDALIVAMTGWSQEENRARSAEAGCSAHLVKPVDFAELERLIGEAARRCDA